MLQPLLTSEKLWPGGIPFFIRPHPSEDLTVGPDDDDDDWERKDWSEECKGWCQFVEVCLVPATGTEGMISHGCGIRKVI